MRRRYTDVIISVLNMYQEQLQEPSPRYNHILASVGNRSYLLGGQTEKFGEEDERKQIASVVRVFDHTAREWVTQGDIAGDARPQTSGLVDMFLMTQIFIPSEGVMIQAIKDTTICTSSTRTH